MMRTVLLVCCAAGVLNSTIARASDWTLPGGGTFAQIMDQGGARTTFTLTNLDKTPAPYTINFYKDDGREPNAGDPAQDRPLGITQCPC